MAKATIEFETRNPDDVNSVFYMILRLWKSHNQKMQIIIQKREDATNTSLEKKGER